MKGNLRGKAEIELLLDAVFKTPGVIGISLGGSQATGQADEYSDWDFGVYYRTQEFDPDNLPQEPSPIRRSLIGEWGPVLNGGATYKVGDATADFLYRDNRQVSKYIAAVRQGDFFMDHAPSYMLGLPSYVLVGELANAQCVRGQVMAPVGYPNALQRAAYAYWRGVTRFLLQYSSNFARRRSPLFHTHLTRTALALAHAQRARGGEWVISEKHLMDETATRIVNLSASGAEPPMTCLAQLGEHVRRQGLL